MGRGALLGELEHLVLLAVLQLGRNAHAIEIRERLAQRAQRRVARGALYGTLSRLQKKGFLHWRVEDSIPERGGIPRRRFQVTDEGIAALRQSRRAIARLSEGLEQELQG